MTANEAAAVAANEVESLTSDERADWLKSGELPSEKPAEVKPEEKPAEKPPAEEATATNFKPSKPAEKKPGQMGYSDLRNRVKELEAENERLKTPRREAEPAPEAAAAPEKKERAKPQATDVDDKGKPKYATYEDYVEDLADWKAEQRIAAHDKQRAEENAKDAQAAEQRKVSEGWAKQVDAARKQHADFDAVALNKDLPVPPGSAVEQVVLASDIGPEILYYLGQHEDKLAEINAMSPVHAVRELLLIEAELGEPEPEEKPAGKRISNAPPPAREVGSRQAVGYDPAAEALEEGNFEAYRAAQNAKELKSKRR